MSIGNATAGRARDAIRVAVCWETVSLAKIPPYIILGGANLIGEQDYTLSFLASNETVSLSN